MTAVSPWVFTAIAIILSAVGHVLYKYYAVSEKRLFLALTAATFIAILGFSFLALKELTIAQVYLCTAMVPILTTIGAWLFIKEKISQHHLIGLFFITTGTILYLFNSV